MKLIEALKVVRDSPSVQGEPLSVFLACGFEPLHLRTFLEAHLRLRFPDRHFTLESGQFGDLVVNLDRIKAMSPDMGMAVLEWSDLDPRLGLRHLGGWGPSDFPDIIDTVQVQAARMREAIDRASQHVPLAVCLPTLPLPPVSFTPGWQSGTFDLRLRESLSSFAASIDQGSRVKIVNPQRIDMESPPAERRDVDSELLAGFPYTSSHASVLAQLLVNLVGPPTPMKGVITDLDGTLWRGVLGDDGVEGVSWDLDGHSQIHGLYQQLLLSLSKAGVLIAVASRNEAALVDQVFQREDLILPKQCLYPLEVHWGPKSESVGRILRTWNIGADSVVFIDDSRIELAEVKGVQPKVECLLFPNEDASSAYDLLEKLRDKFGKEVVTEEDALRTETTRRASLLREEAETPATSPDSFLEGAESELTVSFAKDETDYRALELVNKTNQFNLNGSRYVDSSWRAHLGDPDTVFLLVSYKDKFGPLGKIAVLAGQMQERTLAVDTWVMSCRAFARRIEHKCIELLFENFGLEEIVFGFQATDRNVPLQQFFEDMLGEPPKPGFTLSRQDFFDRCPRLFHNVHVVSRV